MYGVSSISPASVYHQVRQSKKDGSWFSRCMLVRNVRLIEDTADLRPCLRCEPDAPEHGDPVVYFAEMRERRHRPDQPTVIKVGCSRNLELRTRQHAADHGYFRLIGTIPGGFDVEARIHREMRPWARGAEVFAKTDPVLSLVTHYLAAA